MCNAGEIFGNKFRPFENADIAKMPGEYVLDSLSPWQQLTKKIQPQSEEPTHGNGLIAEAIGPEYQQLDCLFHNFLGFITHC